MQKKTHPGDVTIASSWKPDFASPSVTPHENELEILELRDHFKSK